MKFLAIVSPPSIYQFASTWLDWTKLSNIVQMYNIIKDKLVDDRVASWRETPVYTDQHGNEVEESETEQFGREQNVKIDYPNYLIFADKTGCNMNMKKDGHVAGRTYLCKPGLVPQTMCYTNDHQFMVIPLMSVSGEAVYCVIIFQSERNDEVPIDWKSRIDITVEPVLYKCGKPDYNLNIGEGN